MFRSTENDHVKSNLPAKLYRIRSFGVMKLEEFKDLLSPDEYDACKKNKHSKDRWFAMTTKVFIAFLYRVRIFCVSSLQYLYFLKIFQFSSSYN